MSTLLAMGGNVAAGVFFLFLAIAGAVLGLVLVVAGSLLRRFASWGKVPGNALIVGALVGNVAWIWHAFSSFGPWSDSPWYPNAPELFALHWVGNALAAVVAAVVLVKGWRHVESGHV